MKDKEIRKIRKYQIKIAMLIYFCHWVWLSCVVQHEPCILWESLQYDCVMGEFVRKHTRVGRDKKGLHQESKICSFPVCQGLALQLKYSAWMTGAQGTGRPRLFIEEKKVRCGGRQDPTTQKKKRRFLPLSNINCVCRHLFLQLRGGDMMSDMSRSHLVQILELGEWLGEIRFCSLCLTIPS